MRVYLAQSIFSNMAMYMIFPTFLCMVSLSSFSPSPTQDSTLASRTSENILLHSVKNNITRNMKVKNNAERNNMTSANMDTTKVQHEHRCSVTQQQYCHHYVKNIFVLYSGYGGWMMFGIIVLGVLLQLHFLLSNRNISYAQLRRNDLKYFLRKNNKDLRLLVIDNV